MDLEASPTSFERSWGRKIRFRDPGLEIYKLPINHPSGRHVNIHYKVHPYREQGQEDRGQQMSNSEMLVNHLWQKLVVDALQFGSFLEDQGVEMRILEYIGSQYQGIER